MVWLQGHVTLLHSISRPHQHFITNPVAFRKDPCPPADSRSTHGKEIGPSVDRMEHRRVERRHRIRRPAPSAMGLDRLRRPGRTSAMAGATWAHATVTRVDCRHLRRLDGRNLGRRSARLLSPGSLLGRRRRRDACRMCAVRRSPAAVFMVRSLDTVHHRRFDAGVGSGHICRSLCACQFQCAGDLFLGGSSRRRRDRRGFSSVVVGHVPASEATAGQSRATH